MDIIYHPIGIIHSPHSEISGMPIQPSGATGVQGTIEILPLYAKGLKDLGGFSHLILIYHLHRVVEFELIVTPFMDKQQHGVFATRAPKRPNPIGLSVVRLLSVKGPVLHVENLDILDGTPLLDLKPYVPEFDAVSSVRLGWLEPAKGKSQGKRSDDRFRQRCKIMP